MTKTIFPSAVAIVVGFTILVLVEPYGPNQEHWDNPIYWKLVYPSSCLICFALGSIFPIKAWIYGLLIIATQSFPAIINNLNAELIGVSILILVIISVPLVLSGLAGALIRKKYDSKVK